MKAPLTDMELEGEIKLIMSILEEVSIRAVIDELNEHFSGRFDEGKAYTIILREF